MLTKQGKKAARLLRLVGKSTVGDAQARYESRHELLAAVAQGLSFRLYNKNLRWHRDHEYLEVWAGFPAARGAYIHERKFTLYQLAKTVRTVPGDSVECGAFKGGGSYLMLRALQGTNKEHHIFDSFAGLSKPGAEDEVEQARTYSWEEHDMSFGEAELRKNLSEFENVRYYPGWIPARFQEVQDKRFCMVHIDVDLYQPTYDSLAFFYPRVSPGGLIVCDDYGSEACPGAYKALNEFFRDTPESVVHLTTGQGLVIKQ